MKDVFIVSALRTPIGSFGGSLSSLKATKLGSVAIEAAIKRAGINPADVEEVFMGNVLSANLGQAPARQAALGAGVPDSVPCTTVNKVCASGMKALMLATQSIMLGDKDIVVAGGMESMSNAPYYLPSHRWGHKLGNDRAIDGLLIDGLWDPYNNYHMGMAGEKTASEMNITREEQDAFAIESYKRAADSVENGKFDDEIVAVEIPQRKGNPIVMSRDEEYKNVKFDKIPNLRPAFDKSGTVTAANASTINDGAAALVLMSKEKMESLGLKPLAKVSGYADAAQAPEWFTTSPSKAMPKAIEKAGLKLEDIDYFEINEAFAVVTIANMHELNLNPAKVNAFGGAVALGHPLGCSGARIIATLISVLKQNGGRYGCAGICNGGGGASAMVIELA